MSMIVPLQRLVFLCALLAIVTGCATQKKMGSNELIIRNEEARADHEQSYEYTVSISKISKQGNFLHIKRGRLDGVRINEPFHIFAPRERNMIGPHIADAKVVAVRPQEAFLRIEKLHEQVKIRVGYYAKRLKLANQ